MKKNLLLLSISILTGLLFLEGIVRLFNLAPPCATNAGVYRLIDNPRMVYELTPGGFLDQSRINKQGFMDTDFEEEKKANVVRIVMLGDSITEGMRMPIGKKFSDFLEVLLNQKAAQQGSKKSYEVMNFGVGGYNLDAEVELLKSKVLKYSPDIVVLNFAPNDNEPIPGLYLWFVSDNNGLTEKEKALIFNNYLSRRNSIGHFFSRRLFFKSKLYLLVMSRLENLSKIKTGLAFFIRKHHNSTTTDSGKASMRNYLVEIKNLKNEYGFKFLICLHPLLLKHEPSRIPNLMMFEDSLKEFGFPYFHIYGYYKKSVQSPDDIILTTEKEDYCHPNELGHKIIAEAMFSELKRNGFIDLQ